MEIQSSNNDCVLKFGPFLATDLGGMWKSGFGTWEVVDGSLCHMIPEDAAGNGVIIAATPDAEAFNRLGTIKCRLPGAGMGRVHIKMEVSLGFSDGFSVGVDDDAAEWSPFFGMRPVLTDLASGSRGHEHSNIPWPQDGETHQIEIVGEREVTYFLFDGKPLFQAKREGSRPYRQLSIESFARARVKTVEIIGWELAPAQKITQSQPFKMAALVDFADDLCFAEFNEAMIDRMMERLSELKIERVYWMNSLRVRAEAMLPGSVLNERLDGWELRINNRKEGALSGPPSVRACYPFLEKAVKAAHRRGMECYGVIKPFDLSITTAAGPNSPYTGEYFCESHPEAMLKRRLEGATQEPVASLRFFKDDSLDHRIEVDEICLWTSEDNRSYSRYERPLKVTFGKVVKPFRDHWSGAVEEREVQCIAIDGLDISTPYFAVTIEGPRTHSFSNRIYRIAEALDAKGNVVAFERNLPERPRVGEARWDGVGGFVFSGFTTSRQQTGSWRGRDWIEMYQSLDGLDLGIAFQREVSPHVNGAPDPSHPIAREFWLDWVRETLDAGVDGIDIRVMNHINILNWADYGFGPRVEEKFLERYDMPLEANENCRQKHVELLGAEYTSFLREASSMIRGRGKRMQHHVSRPMDARADQKPMINISWDWRRWIEEGLLDAITLKDVELASCFCDEVRAVAIEHGIEVLHCPYLCCLFDSSAAWTSQLKDLLDENRNMGMNGIILYEVAAFMRGDLQGQVRLLYPEVADVLSSVSR